MESLDSSGVPNSGLDQAIISPAADGRLKLSWVFGYSAGIICFILGYFVANPDLFASPDLRELDRLFSAQPGPIALAMMRSGISLMFFGIGLAFLVIIRNLQNRRIWARTGLMFISIFITLQAALIQGVIRGVAVPSVLSGIVFSMVLFLLLFKNGSKSYYATGKKFGGLTILSAALLLGALALLGFGELRFLNGSSDFSKALDKPPVLDTTQVLPANPIKFPSLP